MFRTGRWTVDEINFLRENYAHLTEREIAKHLKKSHGDIHWKRLDLRLYIRMRRVKDEIQQDEEAGKMSISIYPNELHDRRPDPGEGYRINLPRDYRYILDLDKFSDMWENDHVTDKSRKFNRYDP